MFTNFLPKRVSRRAALFASVSTSAALLLSAMLPQNVQPALARPLFRMPFPCGQTWIASTFSSHSPQYAVDFNRDNDFGDPVVASAPGIVIRTENLGDTGYGRYIVIGHGNGWRTVYAHLAETLVQEGQSVSQGQRIGSVGNSGDSSGPHLHYEQRYNGNDVRVVVNGYNVVYFDSYQSISIHSMC